MSVLRKSLDAITIADLDELITSQVTASNELEFKGTLSARADNAEPGEQSGWTEGGDRISDDARDEILSEMVAFANAEGGALILGLHGTEDDPRRAERLVPLPKCEDLARLLLEAAEAVVEPRLVDLRARALPATQDGAGYVVLRVGKTPLGPHRLTTTKEFYVRRDNRASKMEADELSDLMIDLARTADRLEKAFQERRAFAQSLFYDLPQRQSDTEMARLLVRCTALPTAAAVSEREVSRKDAWWCGGEFTMMAGERPYECRYPAREFASFPLIGLKSLSKIDENGRLRRLLTGDGLVEFAFSIEPVEREQEYQPRINVTWAVATFVGVLAQVQLLRSWMVWDAVAYGMEFEIWSDGPLQLRWDDDSPSYGGPVTIDQATPLRLGDYRVGRPEEFDELLTRFVADLHNAWGIEFGDPCSVPWNELLP